LGFLLKHQITVSNLQGFQNLVGLNKTHKKSSSMLLKFQQKLLAAIKWFGSNCLTRVHSKAFSQTEGLAVSRNA
jgi:hypothetical protein